MSYSIYKRLTTINTSTMFQETVSLDCTIDKLLKRNVSIEAILEIVNSVFSSPKECTRAYIYERTQKIREYQKQLQKLLEIPKIEQRSEEWHETRKGIITASEFADALGKGKFRTQKQFYSKKCGYDKEKPNFNALPLKWGTKYEQVASSLYELRQGLKIYEFGLIRHPYIKHFGASPDGINENGVMIEIKCPFMRKITGEVPIQYYFQIQGQLSVCNLYECDYLEVEFDEFEDIDAWLDHVDYEQEHGYVIEVPTYDELNPFRYIYSKIFCNDGMESTKTEALHHINLNMEQLDDKTRSETIIKFWTVRHYNIVRVYRDDNFLKSKFIELDAIWQKVENYRENQSEFKKDYGPSKKQCLTLSEPKTSTSTIVMPPGYAFYDDE